MKKIFLATGFLLLSILSFSQKKAVTETGEEVILYTDGTWKYANDSVAEKANLSTNPTVFKKNVNSTFLLKSTKLNVGIWINTKKWSFKKATDNEAAEYEFQLKGKDLYGMIITENTEIPMESFRTVAVENAKDAAPDIKVVKEEYRMVNGKKILFMQLNGTIQGIKFTYYGYYFSSEKGAVQLLTYTAQNLLTSYAEEMEDLLNGFVILE